MRECFWPSSRCISILVVLPALFIQYAVKLNHIFDDWWIYTSAKQLSTIIECSLASVLVRNLFIIDDKLHAFIGIQAVLPPHCSSTFQMTQISSKLYVLALPAGPNSHQLLHIHQDSPPRQLGGDVKRIPAPTAVITGSSRDIFEVVHTSVKIALGFINASVWQLYSLGNLSVYTLKPSESGSSLLFNLLISSLCGTSGQCQSNSPVSGRNCILETAIISIEGVNAALSTAESLQHRLLWRIFSERLKSALIQSGSNALPNGRSLYEIYQRILGDTLYSGDLDAANSKFRAVEGMHERLGRTLPSHTASRLLFVGKDQLNDYNQSIEIIDGNWLTPSSDQLKLIDEADVIIVPNETNSTHCGFKSSIMVLMRPGKLLLESLDIGAVHNNACFPLAKLLGLRLGVWRQEDKESIVDSLTYRSAELQNLIDSTTNTDGQRFLVYMPWEQLNNQIIGFKCACAVSALLNRTLVLPPVGYRDSSKVSSSDKMTAITFDPSDFCWRPFERYFDLKRLAQNLPCPFITNENFQIRRNELNLPMKPIYYGHGTNSTRISQVRTYYQQEVLGVEFTGETELYPDLFQISAERIVKLFSTRQERILAVASTFWLYDFGRRVEYPLRRYYDYLTPTLNVDYERIMKALWPSNRIEQIATKLANQMRRSYDGRHTILAVHLRRGDYWQKCQTDFGLQSSYANANLLQRCYPSDQHIMQLLLSKFSPKDRLVVYICTNGRRSENNKYTSAAAAASSEAIYDLTGLVPPASSSNWKILLWDDLLPRDSSPVIDDSNDRALVEQLLAVDADNFIGNMWSSFSRHIQEWRTLRGRQTDWI